MKITAILLLVVFGLCITSSIGQVQTKGTYDAARSNVIVILADDLGYGDVGFMGCQDIPTPNIDRIAGEGVVFTSAYVSYAVCGPSRAGLMTGRYQDRFGFGRNPLFAPNDPNQGLPLSEETLAEALRKQDYKSIAIGKWHLGAHESLRPLERGFDDFFGFLSGGHSYYPEDWLLEDEYQVNSQYEAYRTKLLRNDQPVEEDEYLTDALSREAVNYIEKYQEDPFFMYVAYNAPHAPMEAKEECLVRFKHIKDAKRRIYAAMVSAMDDGIGRMLDALDRFNIADNTIIIFLSDNGGPEKVNGSDNGVLRGGKSSLFEGGVRVPFALRWPGVIAPNTVFDQPIISLDIFPTVINRAQAVSRNHLDGVDLLPFILQEKLEPPHDFLYWRKFDEKEYAIRNANGDKLIANKNGIGLFNLVKDKSENHRMIGNQNPKKQIIQDAYDQWMQEMLDPIFLGLKSDAKYSKNHPERFRRPQK